jgi:hypothetical protein
VKPGIIDSLNAQGPIGKILGLDLVLDPNIETTGGVESIFVFRADDLMFFTSGCAHKSIRILWLRRWALS